MTNIHYSNKEIFESIKNNFIEEGSDNIHILSDFDATLTKVFIDGVKRPGILNSINHHNLLGNEFKLNGEKLFKKYYPIENDPKISIEEKTPYMVYWWEQTFELMIKNDLRLDHLHFAGISDYSILRDGFMDFYELLNENKIPLIIMTAGIGELVDSFLKHNCKKLENIDIIANELIWDNKGKLIGYRKPVIHVFNKAETIIKSHENIYNKVKNKKNVILLGDSLGDPHMIEGFNYDNLIKIGFLNSNIDELLEEYLKRYDVVITGDGDMSFINNMLKDFF